MQNLETDVFASEAVVDDTIADIDRYQRKPVGTSDQGHRED